MVSVFTWVRPFTIAFDDVLAKFTTLKGVFKKETGDFTVIPSVYEGLNTIHNIPFTIHQRPATAEIYHPEGCFVSFKYIAFLCNCGR
jgi:hypothetical protein